MTVQLSLVSGEEREINSDICIQTEVCKKCSGEGDGGGGRREKRVARNSS